MIHDSWWWRIWQASGWLAGWLAGWLKKWWWCWWWFSAATHFCRPSFLAVERKKERPQHPFIPSWWSLMMTMILDLGSLSFNSTTSKQKPCIFFCYCLWFLELFDNSCPLSRAFWCSWSGGWCGYCKTQQCMYVCACSSSSNHLGFFFFCWCSSTLEAWWSSSTHNSESKQASRSGPFSSSSSPIFAPFLIIVLELIWNFLSRIPL